MNFKDFCVKTDLLDEFDTTITGYEPWTEANLGDLDMANVISSGLNKITLPNIKKVIGVLAVVAKFSGKKVRDIMTLFSSEGISNIRNFIEKDIIGSAEVQHIMTKFDPDRYKGFKGFEQFVSDMKTENPSIFDSLSKAVQRVIK